MNKRNAQLGFQQHRERIHQGVRRKHAVDFFNLLTGPLLLELTEAHLPAHRERLYPPTVVLSMCSGRLIPTECGHGGLLQGTPALAR